jgi:hypothetical protein
MVTMGWFNIYAAVYNEDHKEIFDFSSAMEGNSSG